ncbi:MAG: DUF3604 domain-containing protein [Candidatus Cloacimonetes bacterium]|nr:DUF3604 domain-containing protein [Candidatus Cloacimonadota bacterium]
MIALGIQSLFLSSAYTVLNPSLSPACEMWFVQDKTQIRLEIRVTPHPEASALELIRPSEMVSEPIKGLTLISDDRTLQCLLPIINESAKQRPPRLNRPYRFFIAPECRNLPLSLSWISHHPEVDVPLRFQLSSIVQSQKHFLGEALLPPSVGPARKIICRRPVFDHLSPLCSGLDSRGSQVPVTGLEYLFLQPAFETSLPSQSGLHNDVPYLLYPKAPSRRPVFFGDLHVHTAFSDARIPVNPDQALKYARFTSLLDFAAITDHAENVFREPLTEREIALTHHAIMEHTIPLEFSAFFGFEWTSTWNNPDSAFGHRNVIYPDLNPNVFSSDQYPDLSEMYQACKDCIGIVHHPMMIWGGYSFKSPVISGFEGPVEVFSTHGNFEKHLPSHSPWFRKDSSVQEGLKRGWKMRLMASSDTHFGHPGLVRFPELSLHDLDGGGVIGVFAPKNTKENIYAAIQKGTFYGTTGPQILLLPSDSESLSQIFPLEVHGTAPIASLHLVEIYPQGLYEQTILLNQNTPLDLIQVLHQHDKKTISLLANMRPCTDCLGYYTKIVQEDGHMAYIGPVWIN